ncbi:hypothetical protein H6503_05275 [Candidatus Woesearchaeota archaeon]|nr:hypothetical protein [Candidatus Woesearchaeota archaeon]
MNTKKKIGYISLALLLNAGVSVLSFKDVSRQEEVMDELSVVHQTYEAFKHHVYVAGNRLNRELTPAVLAEVGSSIDEYVKEISSDHAYAVKSLKDYESKMGAEIREWNKASARQLLDISTGLISGAVSLFLLGYGLRVIYDDKRSSYNFFDGSSTETIIIPKN